MPRNVTSAGVRISRNSDFAPFCAKKLAASCAVKYWPSFVCLTFGTLLTSAADADVARENRVKSPINNFFISNSLQFEFFWENLFLERVCARIKRPSTVIAALCGAANNEALLNIEPWSGCGF